MSPKPCARCSLTVWTCPVAWNRRQAKKIRPRCEGSLRRRKRPSRTRAGEPVSKRARGKAPCHFPTFSPAHFLLACFHELSDRPKPSRRPWPLRALRRPVCPGDVDAPVAGVGGGIFSRAEGPGVSTRAPILPQRILRTAHAALLRRTSHARTQRRENLSQARGLASHRGAQNQQLHWPNPARQADGQIPHYRRNRR